MMTRRNGWRGRPTYTSGPDPICTLLALILLAWCVPALLQTLSGAAASLLLGAALFALLIAAANYITTARNHF
jgi:hypothetical protein